MYNVINGDVSILNDIAVGDVITFTYGTAAKMRQQRATFFYHGLMLMQLQTCLELIGFVLTKTRFAG
jgi:hypothetical protein